VLDALIYASRTASARSRAADLANRPAGEILRHFVDQVDIDDPAVEPDPDPVPTRLPDGPRFDERRRRF